MIDSLLTGPFVPFTLAFALLFGLLALEILFLMLGATLLGDGADIEAELPDLGDVPELDLDFDGLDVDAGEFDLAAAEDIAVETPSSGTNALGWMGLGKMPIVIWLGTFCLSFGLSGLALQNVTVAVLGAPLPALVAVLPALLAAFWFTGRFGTVFARLLPKSESQSVSERNLARRTGTVTQGTARRGTPAEVRVTDRHGNSHYLRAEPLADADEIAQGARVLVLRHRPTGRFRLVELAA